jgi:hypothetical protein
MMRNLLVIFLLMAGCKKSGSSTPSPNGSGSGSAACGNTPGEPLTQEQCTCLGGRVNASTGGGAQAHCAAGETELGNVRFGIEGGWCCKTP